MQNTPHPARARLRLPARSILDPLGGSKLILSTAKVLIYIILGRSTGKA